MVLSGFIGLLIQLLVLALVAGLVWYIIGLFSLPAPIGKVVRAIFMVLVVLVLISLLLGVGPYPVS